MKRKKKSNGRRAIVSAETFVKAWVRGGTIDDVATRAGMSVTSAGSRAARFRKAGVALPVLERRGVGRAIDVAALNAIIKAR